jgi:hypothetical protein
MFLSLSLERVDPFYIRPRFNLFCLKNSLNPFAVDHIQQHECRAYRTL